MMEALIVGGVGHQCIKHRIAEKAKMYSPSSLRVTRTTTIFFGGGPASNCSIV
jgi:hypothetical protein